MPSTRRQARQNMLGDSTLQAALVEIVLPRLDSLDALRALACSSRAFHTAEARGGLRKRQQRGSKHMLKDRQLRNS
ncbi:hypothetical protein WJX73_001671 [Symbiochloris irregularis]|uniref:Uncharacterized protein n=1 Tax=Symbiochloris irregularis TaxID=706552 RepID=A0AAW1NYH8_9CHLO